MFEDWSGCGMIWIESDESCDGPGKGADILIPELATGRGAEPEERLSLIVDCPVTREGWPKSDEAEVT